LGATERDDFKPLRRHLDADLRGHQKEGELNQKGHIK
jgi:hypothetical protein